MQFTAIAIMAAVASITSAAPTTEPRQFQAQLSFLGAAGAEYTISAPTTATKFFTGKKKGTLLKHFLSGLCSFTDR